MSADIDTGFDNLTPLQDVRTLVINPLAARTKTLVDEVEIIKQTLAGMTPTPVDANFKGFFENLGSVISEVENPISGKSYAYAKDGRLEGGYYTPYYYNEGGWESLPQDPPIIYSHPDEEATLAVSSIKPDSRIIIDRNGQLDLSGLASPAGGEGESGDPQLFHGFFKTTDELKKAVTNPVENRSMAYVSHGKRSWMARQYRKNAQGEFTWSPVTPVGAFTLMDKGGEVSSKIPVLGFYKSDLISYDTNGFLSVNNSQQVIDYNHSWEVTHNDLSYMGNLFYDATSRTWMGWGEPSLGVEPLDNKWTRVIHPHMSDHVKDLSKRVPPRAPVVVSGITGDSDDWRYTGWSYVERDDITLPEEFRDRCGAYLFTMVKDSGKFEGDIPPERMQICYPDEDSGTSYFRRWDKTAEDSALEWNKWAKMSLSQKDIDDHANDKNAHSDSHRFYKVSTIDLSLVNLKDRSYYIQNEDLLLLADSRGMISKADHYTVIPYTGQFKFSGKISVDGLGTGAPYATSGWILKVVKVSSNGNNKTIFECTFNHSDTQKYMPNMSWESQGIDLLAGEQVFYYLQPLNNAQWEERYPSAQFIPMRTFFVIEDVHTDAGSMIADTHLRTSGKLYSRGDTGINVHYAYGTSGTVRVYGSKVDTSFKPMTKV